MDAPQFDTKNLKIFNDNAIDNATSFNFDSYVKSIKKIILHPENTTPFSISINGKWGSGKTSLMKTLRRELNSNPQPHEREVRTVWFNAWKYSNTDNLLAALASEIYQEMVYPPIKVKKGFWEKIKGLGFHISENVNIPQQITDLAKIVSLGKSPDFSKWGKTPEYKKYLPYYVHFQQFLQRVLSYFVLSDILREYDDKKGVLVIFIDDLDRCPPKNITTLLESVNLFFDQEGCIFVFGMDLALISNAIEKQYSKFPGFSGKNYIEKLIQLQFNLPEIRDEDIKAFFEQGIADDEPLRKYIDLIISCSGRNPRKIKQFINSLRLMMTLSSVIENLHVEEELLIKWTLLNFISSRFVNEIKNQKDLLLFVQGYAKTNDPNELDILEEETRFYSEKFVKLVYEFNNDPIICKILRDGSHEFTSENLGDYIFLSSITPKEPLVTIQANKDSFILGNSISFSGTCVDGGERVRLMLVGPGLFSNGMVEITNPDVLDSNKWNYTWAPGYSIQPGAFTAYVFDAEKRVSDHVEFLVHKGAVTIVASGDQTYYLGEKIKFSGTCTAGDTVYLSITSPDPYTQNRRLDQISVETIDNDQNTFVKVEVKEDKTWEYGWDTSKIASLINEGMYTIYACEGPFTRNNLENKAYGTASIILKKPFVSATASQSTVAQGDHIYISGTAEGEPKQGVQIWIFGENRCLIKTTQVNPNASFSLILTQQEIKTLDLGVCFVIVQHPMMNNEFDVYLDTDKQNVLSNYPKKGTELFSIVGPQSIKGAEAAMALIDAINNPNIDDTYTKLQFLIEEPIITIDTIGDKHIGVKFPIIAYTNLAVDDEVLFQVYSSTIESMLDKKIFHGEFPGVSGTVKVLKGDSGWNKLVFNCDTSSFPPEEYVVIANAVNQNASTTILFTISE